MSANAALLRLLGYARAHRRRLWLASTFSVLNKIFDIAPEILIGIAIDVIVSQKESFIAQFGIVDPWHQIIVLAVLTFFIWAGESLFEYLLLIYWRGLAQTVQNDLRLDAYRHVQQLDLSYFEDKSTGNLVSILNDDINQLERFLDGGANQIIQTVTAVIGVGAVFFAISPTIAWAAYSPIPVIVFGAFYFQKLALPLYAEVRERVGAISARLSNNISGIMTIKSFTTQAREVAMVRDESQAYLAANRKAIAVSSAFIPIIRMAILFGFLATFTLGAWKVLHGELAVGSYGVLVFLTQRLLWPLTSLAATADLYERAMASARRVLDLLNTPIKIQSGNLKPQTVRGHFRFLQVQFRYASGPTVLDGITLDIPADQTTAFVGSTGSGKSTLVKLLLRFYDINAGQLTLDGQELSHYDVDALRTRIGLVSQDVFLFHGTVRDNIAYGAATASEEQIIKAATLAEAHEFISKLSNGYDTIIGERGQKLSGGQRQRISIARALMKNPDVLILDEATSAVDNETEAAIQKSLAVVSKGRTTIIIAHRLSTVVHADRIYVLENGQIVESGAHRELIARNGFYRQLWDVQTGQAYPVGSSS